MQREIFVFGSNLAGRHGKGAAKFAMHHHGAIYGKGAGPMGDSYAIPTKDEHIKTLPLNRIKPYVDEFKRYVQTMPRRQFRLTPFGTGLAGYSHEDILPMLADLQGMENIIWPEVWAVRLDNPVKSYKF